MCDTKLFQEPTAVHTRIHINSWLVKAIILLAKIYYFSAVPVITKLSLNQCGTLHNLRIKISKTDIVLQKYEETVYSFCYMSKELGGKQTAN